MPTLTPTSTTASSLSANGSRTVAAMRAATPLAVARSAPSGSSTANSSPPRRATVSPGRTQRHRRRANSCSRRSPTWWPSVSLTSLKRSRSSSRRPVGRPSRSVARTASSSRSCSRTRLARPVSASWVAWWRSRACCSSASVVSRTTATSRLSPSSAMVRRASSTGKVPPSGRTARPCQRPSAPPARSPAGRKRRKSGKSCSKRRPASPPRPRPNMASAAGLAVPTRPSSANATTPSKLCCTMLRIRRSRRSSSRPRASASSASPRSTSRPSSAS